MNLNQTIQKKVISLIGDQGLPYLQPIIIIGILSLIVGILSLIVGILSLIVGILSLIVGSY